MLACINFALAVFALSVGGHALAWILRDRAERDGRVSCHIPEGGTAAF
jgi:hypothetical protein